MATNAIAKPNGKVIQLGGTDPHAFWYSLEAVQERVELIMKMYRAILKENIHFGKIPGCKKPSLYKAGSEHLLTTFRIAIRPVVTDLSTPDCARFRVTCQAYHVPTKMYLGSGVGECSSDEAKYKWREMVCLEEFEATPSERRRVLWKHGHREPYCVHQVRQEFADVANTVLKMAKKRAQIDVTLTVTGCSDIFTQDLEDMDHPVDTDSPAQTQEAPADKYGEPRRMAKEEEPAAEILWSSCARHGKYKGAACPGCDPPAPQNGNGTSHFPPSNEGPKHEVSRSSAPKITDGQARRFYAIWNQHGYTRAEVKAFLKRHWNIENDRDIPAADYEKAIRWAEGK